jgi:hypothetical protein
MGRDLNGFQYISAPLVSGVRDHSICSRPTLPSDATLQKNMYGLGVEISMVFEILRHFLIKGGRDHHVQ